MFTLIDAGQLLAAVLAASLIVALPGLALSRILGFARDQGVLGGIVVGLAVLPLLDSLATRILGIDAALVITLGLAGWGVFATVRDGYKPAISGVAVVALIVWLAIVVGESVDLDLGGKLYQPLTVIDTVKHAATTQAILDSGAPPHDPFFLRPERASYYYFFYTLTALVQRLGFGLVSARAAFGGLVVWTGIGLFGLVRLLLARIAVRPSSDRSLMVLTLAVLAAGGLDIIGVVRMGLLQGIWLAEPLNWNEQVAGWLESLLWVPHHVTGLIAGMVGLIALAEIASPAEPDASSRNSARRAALAGCCFASALGLSVWVTLGLVATVAAWGVVLMWERRWRLLAWLVAAGALALVLAAPQMHDLAAGRAVGGAAPIVATVRAFTPIDGLIGPGPWRYVARLLALPLNYFAAFGVLASGAILYWRRVDASPRPELGRVLVITAAAGLILGAFLKSTLFNNDLGWRVVLLPLLAATVWTIAALDRAIADTADVAWARVPRFLLALLVLGWATSAYALAGMRAYPWLSNEPQLRFMAADPATERALRVAYQRADRDLPPDAVLQHDPSRPRAFAFALYGRHRVAVADSFGALFGADAKAVDARVDAVALIFQTPLPIASVRATAVANGIDDLIVTVDDPIWSRPDGFVWHAPAAYASDSVRIIPVATLGDAPAATPTDARSAATPTDARSAATPTNAASHRLGG